MSKVSALVSAYYASKFLDARITNLFGAKKKVDLEVVVICQTGSPEDEIAQKYNVKLVHTPGIPTIGKAWNEGIKVATGDLLTTANTDDKYLIGGLKYMVDCMEKNPDIGLVFSQVDVDDGMYQYPWKRIENDTGEIERIGGILEKRCIVGPMPLWRKAIHEDLGYFKESMIVASDYDMWLRMARNGIKFFYIAESCGVYMKREDSLEHRNRARCIAETREARA